MIVSVTQSSDIVNVTMNIGDFFISSSESYMNIGVIPASHMNFDGHIKNIYSVAFYHIRNIAKIKKIGVMILLKL